MCVHASMRFCVHVRVCVHVCIHRYKCTHQVAVAVMMQSRGIYFSVNNAASVFTNYNVNSV